MSLEGYIKLGMIIFMIAFVYDMYKALEDQARRQYEEEEKKKENS